jgi:chromosome segregation ATPase
VKSEVIAAEVENARIEEEKDQIVAAMAARQELKQQQQALDQQQQQGEQQREHPASEVAASEGRIDVYETKDSSADSGEWHVNTRPGQPRKKKIGIDTSASNTS